MKWSKQKCRKVAFVFSLSYTLLGCLVMMILDKYDVDSSIISIFLTRIIMVFTAPIWLYFIFIVLVFNGSILPIIISLVIMMLIIYGLTYIIIWRIKGEREK